jgi:ATP-binding cassette subfamily F protein uup
VATRIVELSDGKFFWHNGNYTDYLLAKAERQAGDAVVEHKRQMFLKKELAYGSCPQQIERVYFL